MKQQPSEETPSTLHRRLRYQDDLDPVMDIISQEYHASEEMVYRSVCNIPPTVYDITPQGKREESQSGEAIAAPMNAQMVEALKAQSKKQKRKYISEHSISVFSTPELLKSNTLQNFDKISQKYGIDEANAYLNHKRGNYICRIQLANNGLISKFTTSGHADLLIYEDVSELDLYDTSFAPIQIIQSDETDTKNTNERP